MAERTTLEYQYQYHAQDMRRHLARSQTSGGYMMRSLSLILCAIGLIAVGAVLCACIFFILGWTHLVQPVVWIAWGGIWRLGVLAIALFILITLIESLRS